MLDWLIGRVKYLTNRISTLWNAAWNWAVSKAQDAYNRAVAWASSQVGKIRSLAWSLYYQVRDYATSLRNGLVSTILYWYNRAVGAARAIVKGVEDVLKALISDGAAWALYHYRRAVAGAQALVKGVSDTVTALRNRVLVWLVDNFNRAVASAQALVKGATDVFNALIQQAQVKLEDFKARIGLADPLQSSLLLQFLQHPGRFILAYVWNMFLEFLEWSLAYAIGTTIDPLPPLPEWFGKGRGGVILIGTGPPPGSSGLAPPLDRLRVSGHSFRQGHPGIDLGLTMGTPVYTMHSGVVEIAKWSTIGYGFYVTIRSDEWWTLYGHLDVLNVRSGQRVKQSDTIGLGNSTGNSTGPHLHLEIKHRGSYIDPLTVL